MIKKVVIFEVEVDAKTDLEAEKKALNCLPDYYKSGNLEVRVVDAE